MMEQVRFCAVWRKENWLGSSMNQFRLYGLRIYGFSGNMDNFWLVANGLSYKIFRIYGLPFGYMNFFEAIETSLRASK